jgi:copper oxidase (laccase) domain-containing protein
VDLVAFTEKQLLNVGVLPENIFESSIDTASDKHFFSHVRDKNLPIEKQGRFACVVGLI